MDVLSPPALSPSVSPSAPPSPVPTAPRTFRDPAGSVELRPDGAYRFIHPGFEAELLEFLTSPLAARLVADRRLVSSEVLTLGQAAEASQPGPSASPADPHAGREPLVLRHPLIAFPSFPWEWSPAFWLAAAELTLSLSRDLLAEGWILKDATPLNILFRGTEPVFVDVLSVARLDRTQPIWFAYGQFIRTFLLPMIAHTHLGWPLRATVSRRDGYEPEELYPLLSPTARLRQPVLSSITLPSLLGRLRSGRGGAGQGVAAARRATDRGSEPELVEHILRQTYKRLGRQMRRAVPPPQDSRWTAYSGTATHYSEADHAAKRAFVAAVLERTRPARVLDVGCNSGVYSELAAGTGAEVVSIDTDVRTVDRLCRRLAGSGKSILPLVVDLANPTPAAGWRNRESAGFLARCAGRFHAVLMLAVIHHLLLHDGVPLAEVAELCVTLTAATLILEWVPPTDIMFRELVRGREAIFAALTETNFRAIFSRHFRFAGEHRLANGRVLFHLERLAPAAPPESRQE